MGLFDTDIVRVKKNKLNGLIKSLDHPKASVRYNAIIALARKKDLTDEIKTRLKDVMYNDPDPWVKTIATLRFAELGDPLISETLLQIINEGSQNSKLELLRFIAKNGASANVTTLQILMIALKDKNILVRLQAIIAANVSKNKLLIPVIGEMLHEKSSKVRLLAAKALYNIGRDESLDYLVGLLSDKNTELLSAVRIYIANIINDRAFNARSDESSTQPAGFINEEEAMREKAIRESRQEIIRKGLSILENACMAKYRGVRIEALKSIAVFKSPSSIDIVEKLYHDRFPEVRIEALIALEKIGGKRALEIIENAPRDKKKVIRQAVDRALARMRKPQ